MVQKEILAKVSFLERRQSEGSSYHDEARHAAQAAEEGCCVCANYLCTKGLARFEKSPVGCLLTATVCLPCLCYVCGTNGACAPCCARQYEGVPEQQLMG